MPQAFGFVARSWESYSTPEDWAVTVTANRLAAQSALVTVLATHAGSDEPGDARLGRYLMSGGFLYDSPCETEPRLLLLSTALNYLRRLIFVKRFQRWFDPLVDEELDFLVTSQFNVFVHRPAYNLLMGAIEPQALRTACLHLKLDAMICFPRAELLSIILGLLWQLLLEQSHNRGASLRVAFVLADARELQASNPSLREELHDRLRAGQLDILPFGMGNQHRWCWVVLFGTREESVALSRELAGGATAASHLAF